jgi:hypothetical protein
MFYFDLYFINIYVILPPDWGPFAVNKYIHKECKLFVIFIYNAPNMVSRKIFPSRLMVMTYEDF